MAEPVLLILDQDCSSLVKSWGKMPAVRKLKLSDSSLFASTYSLTLDNAQGDFTPGGPRSLFPKVGWAGSAVSITKDGKERYSGFIGDLQVDDEASTVTLDLTTNMTKMADVIANLTETGLNPAMACLGLLVDAGLEEFLNRASFSVAAGYLGDNVIDVDSPSSKGETCLSLASKIADVCSLDFVLVRGQVYCYAQRPWDGTESGLRQEINGDNAHSFSELKTDASTFANQVKFSWGGSGDVLTVDNVASQRAERNKDNPISVSVDATSTAKIKVTTEAVARFYANLLLARISPRRYLLDVTLGPDFDEVLPTQRFPVSYAGLALSSTPFEVNDVQQNADSDEIVVTIQKLEVVR